MEEATNGWNLNFIYEFLYHVRNLQDIDHAINWLAEMWEEKHFSNATYATMKDSKLVEDQRRFALSLKDIKDTLIHRFESEERKEALKWQMLMGYKNSEKNPR